MRSQDRALHGPGRLHSRVAGWRRTVWGLHPDPCDVGVLFLSVHGRPRGPITTLTGLGSTDLSRDIPDER